MSGKKEASLWRNLDKLSANIIIEDYDAAKEHLAELEIDADELAPKGVNKFKKIQFLAKAKVNQAQDLSLLEKLRGKIKESFEQNATLAGEILRNALTEKKASFQFRKLEEWSDDQVREILADIDLAKLLEDLEDMND